MCGRPREDAAGLLQQSEQFDRGFYAGPFGWLSAGAAEFAVAIRSALLHAPLPVQTNTADGSTISSFTDGSTRRHSSWPDHSEAAVHGTGSAQAHGEARDRCISLFAGVGIVNGSQPDSEWAELELKVRPNPAIRSEADANKLSRSQWGICVGL